MSARLLQPTNSVVASHPGVSLRSLLSAIVDSSTDAVLSTTLDGTITSWNRSAERIFGYGPAEIIGLPTRQLVPERLQDEEAELIGRIKRDEAIEHFESIRVRKDGNEFPVALSVSPIRSEDEEIIGAAMIIRDITKQKRAHEAVVQLAAIVASSDDAIIGKNLDGTITSWNQAAERMFGYKAEEIVGNSVLKLIPSELHSEEPGILARLADGDRVDHFETVRVANDGRKIPVSLTVSPIRDENGKVTGASKVVRDVTDQKRSIELAHYLAAIVESSDDAVISKNLQGMITSWNAGAERVFGYMAEEMVGQSVLKLIPPELQHEEPGILARLAAGERIDHYETVRLRKNGSRFDVSLTISPIKDDAGRVVGASKVARDISVQREAEVATRLLAAIVDSSDDAIVSKNLDGIVTSWNAGAERLFGYTAEEMIGRPVATLFPPDRLNEEPMILDRLKRGERVDHYQTIRVHKSGRKLDVSLTISPIKDPSGKIIGASKIARDISKEKEALSRLARANEELRRADRMKSEFLAVMSHELRTPLNSIIGFTAMVRAGKQGEVNPEQKKSLNLIHASGKHLLHLINDLLDLSRIEAGRMDVEPEVFSIDEILEEATRTMELQIKQKDLDVRRVVEVEGSSFSDRKRVFQVVLNLLNNAIKFTPSGSITLRASREGKRLVVAVTDTGIGIPKERQSDLFRAFSQVEGSSRRRYEGTGLGLYLCKKIVTMLGGEIILQSAPNRGSTFTFWIPDEPGALPTPAAETFFHA